METWDYAHCLPYFKRMETCLAASADDPFRGHDGPLVLERGPATQPAVRGLLRGRAAGRLPAHRRRQRLPAGGLRAASTATSTAAGGSPPRAPTSTRSWAARTSTCGRGRSSRGSCSRAGGRSASSTRAGTGRRSRVRGRRGHPVRRRDQLARSSSSSRASGNAAELRPLGIDVVHDLPGVGREPPGPPRGLHPVRVQAAGLDAARAPEVAAAVDRLPVALPPARARGDQPLRGRRLRPLQRRRRLPQPDVPLPAARDPLRRLGPGGRPRLPGARRADVLRRARVGEDHVRRSARPPGAALQLPVDRPGPPRVGRGDPRRAARSSTSPPSTRSTAARLSPGPAVETDEQILDWVAPGRRDRAPPVLHRRMGTDELSVVDPATHAGPRPRRAARRGRLGHALRHQRQHLRAGDDGRREGRRPDPRQHAAAAGPRPSSTGIGGADAGAAPRPGVLCVRQQTAASRTPPTAFR